MILRSLCHNHTVLLIFWICIMCQARISLNIKISFPLKELQVTAVNLGSLYSARPRRWKLEWSMLTTGRNTYICHFENCCCREASWLDTPLQNTRLLFNHYSWALVVLPLSCTVCMYTYMYVCICMHVHVFYTFSGGFESGFCKVYNVMQKFANPFAKYVIYGEFCKNFGKQEIFELKRCFQCEVMSTSPFAGCQWTFLWGSILCSLLYSWTTYGSGFFPEFNVVIILV